MTNGDSGLGREMGKKAAGGAASGIVGGVLRWVIPLILSAVVFGGGGFAVGDSSSDTCQAPAPAGQEDDD